MKEAKSLLEIIKSFLYEKQCNIDNNIDEIELYKLARTNSVSNFLQNWAQSNCKSDKIKNNIYKDYCAQIVKDTNQEIETEKILNALEQNNIKTLVVKGVIMKNIYPQNYMRKMCDIDILVDKTDFKKASQIIENMGYDKFYNHEKHLVFTKQPLIMIEMHRLLILKKDIGYEYFKNVWPLCEKYKEYKNIYQLSKENAYIFCILHMLIHFKFTGVTIKDMLDVYLYNEKYKQNLDYKKIDEVFLNLGLKEFENNIKEIAYKWFDKDEIDNFDEVEEYILKGESSENKVNYDLGESNSKLNYIKKLLFPKMDIMKEKYPVLKKAPVLLPVMWCSRIFKDIFTKAIPFKTRIDTIKLIKEADKEKIENVKNIYNKLGIK